MRRHVLSVRIEVEVETDDVDRLRADMARDAQRAIQRFSQVHEIRHAGTVLRRRNDGAVKHDLGKV